MWLIIFFCVLFNSLNALPVINVHRSNERVVQQHPYQSGLIRDYNSHQKFEYKFTDRQSTRNESPNQHRSLPLTTNELNDQFEGQSINKLDSLASDIRHSTSSSTSKHTIDETISSIEKSSSTHKPDAPSAVLSELFTRVNRRYMNSSSKRKEKMRLSTQKQQERHQTHNLPEVCPESSVATNVDLDPVSKGYLSPILFSGKLSSLSEDYTGRVAATFQVLRVLKTTSVEVKDQFGQTHKVPIQLAKGHQVVLHFVSKPGQRFVPPHCSVFMNSSAIGSLRLEQKYFVYAAAPVQSLQEMHRHSFGSVTYKAEINNEITPINTSFIDSNQVSNQLNSVMSDFNNSNESFVSSLNDSLPMVNDTQQSADLRTAPSNRTVKMSNLIWMNDQHYQLSTKSTNSTDVGPSIPFQFIVHYLSAFYAPEPFSKNVSKAMSKTLCKKCAQKAQVEGSTGDVRVQVKNKLRLRCKISGNPQPWVEWLRNGKKLRNKGRISIKNTKKLSRLEITRVESSDSGYYECRVKNVASKQAVVAKTRVIVLNQRKPNRTTKEQTTTTTTTTTPANLWPLIGQPCPMNNFCLNGGVCTFFENVFEYVCQCAPGYRGLRCEEKDISLNEHHAKSITDTFGSALRT